MKAKLIKKRFDFYGLKVDNKIIATNNVEVNKMFNYPFTISLKNCQAIERGYDLDELARKSSNLCEDSDVPVFKAGYYDGFKEGFQKALEILGDKKFSEEDLHQALHLMNNRTRVPIIGEALDIIAKIEKQRSEIIQSLQQTEWDVEVEMEKFQSRLYIKPHEEEEYKSKPIELQHPYTTNPDEIWEYNLKLDAEGCLILKRTQL